MTNAQVIHICNSLQPARNPKIAKEYSYLNPKKEKNITYNKSYNAYPAE